ncbi:MAG: DUF4199 domain-containing protein [Paludibacter sp.]
MQRSFVKSAMNSGLIMGVIFSVNFLLSVSRITALMLITYVIAIFIVITMYRMAVRFRDTECEGSITYGRAFLYILSTFFYAALISTVVKYIYFQFINPSYLETMFQESMKLMEKLKLPMTSVSADQMESMLKPVNYSFIYIWMNIIFGGLVGLMMAGFIKKEKSIFDEKGDIEN